MRGLIKEGVMTNTNSAEAHSSGPLHKLGRVVAVGGTAAVLLFGVLQSPAGAVAKTTTTKVTSSINPTVTGQPVTFTAKVTPSVGTVASLTGSVWFGGLPSGSCSGGNGVPVVAGLAQCVVSGGLLHAGSPFAVRATYGHDPAYAGSSGKVSQVVDKAGATLALTSNAITCSSPDLCTAPQGTPVTFTATAAAKPPGAGIPAGPVVFSVVEAGKTKSLTCQGGNTMALSGGQATCSFPHGLPATVYSTVTATLQDPSYRPASATMYLNTTQLATTTTIADPKTQACGWTAGWTCPIVATVTPNGSSSIAPTGPVDVTVCTVGVSPRVCKGISINIFPANDGTVSLYLKGGLVPGKYEANAKYLGDANYYASTAAAVGFTVVKAPTFITISSSENASVDGDPVTFTAVIQRQNPNSISTLVGSPTGSMTFDVQGPSGRLDCSGGDVVPLSPGTVQGVVTCAFPAGVLTDPAAPDGNTDYTVHVSYPGDSNFLGSTATFTQTVVPIVS